MKDPLKEKNSSFWSEVQAKLQKKKEESLFRRPLPAQGIDFCSNDYLGLSNSPLLQKEWNRGMELDGTGSSASRLVRGHFPVWDQFERKFAEFVEAEGCLLVTNGTIANQGLLDSIADPRTVVFCDRNNHASILDGIRLSKARRRYYEHLDLEDLRKQILKEDQRQGKLSKKVIISETLFSMEGDSPDLKGLIQIKEECGAILVLDEAHALGVFGPQGQGLSWINLSPEERQKIDFRIYTFGKSFGLFGACIATRRTGVEYLTNFMRSYIFSTALPPGLGYSLLKSLELVKDSNSKRELILQRSTYVTKKLQELGFKIPDGNSQILPILCKSPAESLKIASLLQEKGLDIRAIRPPTVSISRLRLSLNSKQSQEDINFLLEELGLITKYGL